MTSYCERFKSTYTILFMALILTGIGVLYLFKTQKDETLSKAQEIYKVLDKHRITYDIDAHSVEPTFDATPKPIIGISECIAQIATLIAQKQPINMFVVGFPFKSPNHEKKTIGDLPDMAERKSLEYLQGILEEIKTVYSPGAQLRIFIDGIMFAEFVGLSPQTVLAYENALQHLIADLPNIKLYTSTDLMQIHKLQRLEDINAMMDTYGSPDEKHKASTKPAGELMRKRIALELDSAAGRKMLEHQTLDDVVFGLLAREARMRIYMSKLFPADKFLRLTVHFSGDVGKKFGIKLSPNSNVTPYHGVLVEEEDESWSIKFKRDIDLNNYELRTKKINGIDCPYFKRKEKQ